MPEGHTLHRLAGQLDRAFTGHAVRITSPQGRFAAEAEQVDGAVVEAAEAWGKHLFLDLGADRQVHVHLGLYGKLAVHRARPDEDPEVPEPVGQVRMRLVAEPSADGGRPAYADLRGATACELLTGAGRDMVLERLGPDPLRADADPERAWARIHRSRTTIAALLMDQKVIAGIGNVYRAEVLFRHRVDPYRTGQSIQRRTFDAMWDDLVVLMADGVRTGRIDTVRPEDLERVRALTPTKRRYGGEGYVYKRQGEPCYVCGTKIRTEELVGRNLFWCPRCQRATKHRAVQ